MTNPKIQVRHDTSTNWATANPILLEGEIGYETNTGKVKIGNGTSNYNTLSYNFEIDTSKFVQKSGDTMTGKLKTPSLFTNTIYSKDYDSYIVLGDDRVTINGDLAISSIQSGNGDDLISATFSQINVGDITKELSLKTSANTIKVTTSSGDKTLAYTDNIPTTTSQLYNDSNFATTADIPQDYVKTTGTQTVAGNKTFTGYTTISNHILPTNYYNSNHSIQYGRLTFNGDNLQLNSINGGINLQCKTADDKIYKINSTATTTKYQVYTQEDKSDIIDLSMGSSNITTLTLATAGKTYTASDYGYFKFSALKDDSSSGYFNIQNTISKLNMFQTTTDPNGQLYGWVPVAKNDIVLLWYGGIKNGTLQFIKAKGVV